MKFCDLFKDKFKSRILCEYIEQMIRDMTELKRKNYYAQQEIDQRNAQIDKFKEALKELNIEVSENYNPNAGYGCDDEDF